MKVPCWFNNIFVREAAEICLRTSLIFILAVLCEFTPEWQGRVFSINHLSILKTFFSQLIALKNKGLDELYILVTCICNGLEEVCISVIGIWRAGCLKFRVFSPVLQKFCTYLFMLYYIGILLNLKIFKF